MVELRQVEAALETLDLAQTECNIQLLRNLRHLHLRKLKDLYEQYKMHVEVLERAELKKEPYRYSVGEAVLYVPEYACGDVHHPNCERGTVSSISDSTTGSYQNVWVRFNDGDTGAKTAYTKFNLYIPAWNSLITRIISKTLLFSCLDVQSSRHFLCDSVKRRHF